MIIEVHQVQYTYSDGTKALEGVDFEIPGGSLPYSWDPTVPEKLPFLRLSPAC